MPASSRLASTANAWSANPSAREGIYRLTPQFHLRVFRDDGRLKVQGTGQAAIAADVVEPDRIEARAVGAGVAFNRDAKGGVVSATLRQGGALLEGPKD